ncbi:tyrosine-type recombinase/integrase [Flavobacterium lindanitolerans]|jgi:integrase/recombinase XerD|uniref:tyrosine-type recombinase/integrase n=1 Tax=Flavobacterium lindanitolerans TaxID=428988 RepID=UPI0023F02BD1|nr:tyrosine-type recombinase/integrase [Flavobacterium lindanitolerans]
MKKQIQSPASQDHFQDYETYIKAKAFKGKSYTAPVKEFLIWMEDFGIASVKQITSVEMLRYYEYLIERPNQRRPGGLSGTTIKMHMLCLSFFLDSLLRNDQIEKAFFIPRFSSDDQKPRNVLTVDEIKILYGIAENQLERALLSVAYGCGLRRSEMESLNVSDVQLSIGMLIVRSGKGGKRREVPMSDSVLQAVQGYVREYRCQFVQKPSETAFFLNTKGNRMCGDSLNKRLKKIIERTKSQTIIDKEITLHCLRHSIAHHLSENNAGIDFIRDFLGHSFIDTAYIYAIKNKHRISINKPQP